MRRNSPSELSTPIAILSSRRLGAEEVGQLGDVGSDASRLIAGHQMRRRSHCEICPHTTEFDSSHVRRMSFKVGRLYRGVDDVNRFLGSDHTTDANF